MMNIRIDAYLGSEMELLFILPWIVLSGVMLWWLRSPHGMTRRWEAFEIDQGASHVSQSVLYFINHTSHYTLIDQSEQHIIVQEHRAVFFPYFIVFEWGEIRDRTTHIEIGARGLGVRYHSKWHRLAIEELTHSFTLFGDHLIPTHSQARLEPHYIRALLIIALVLAIMGWVIEQSLQESLQEDLQKTIIPTSSDINDDINSDELNDSALDQPLITPQ